MYSGVRETRSPVTMPKRYPSPFPYSQSISFRLNSPSPKKRFISILYYHPKLAEMFAAVQEQSYVDLSYWNLIDHDMVMVGKQLIQDKRCTELNLCGNKITSFGASIIAASLTENVTLKSLDLSFNRLADEGVRSLCHILVPNRYTSLQKLYLSKNGISNESARSLAAMLKTNDTVIELWLSHNELGSEGVKPLANALAFQNRTLKVLVLSYNPFITDACVDDLLAMLRHNRTMNRLAIDNCSLSERGRRQLRDRTILKINFQVSV